MKNEQHDVRYEALVRHDSRLDGVFYYAVKTTGVFCRPSCKSRTPRPENVEYFAAPAAARGAGYRACKRCKPEAARTQMDERFITLCRAIEQAEEAPTLASLAALVQLSASHVQRKFTAAIGVSPKAYAQTVKRERLRNALKSGIGATRAIYEAGFSSSSQAYDSARAPLGMPPAQFAKGGRNAIVAYAIVDSALGRVLVAATSRGICRVDLGDDDAALERRLRSDLPHASIERTDDALASATSLIVAYLAGNGPWPKLPLDVRGTAFQTRVWEALRALLPGTAISYAQLASIIGSPQSARAVARACASNTIALLIPCHRIVPQSGGVGGYRWGPVRKERLLELERRFSRD